MFYLLIYFSIIVLIIETSLIEICPRKLSSVGTKHKICKARGSNPDHYKKKIEIYRASVTFF